MQLVNDKRGWLEQAAPGVASAFNIISLTNQSERFSKEKDFEASDLGVLLLKLPRETFLDIPESPTEPPGRSIIWAGRALARESPETCL